MNPATPCTYCGCHTYITRDRARRNGNEDMLRTKDHVIPVCKGGTQTVVCCLRCNQAKADGCAEEFTLFARLFLKRRSPRPSSKEAKLAFQAWFARALF